MLESIQELPTTINNIHESCFKSYHILHQILLMVERGDSPATIREVYSLLMSSPKDTKDKPNTTGND